MRSYVKATLLVVLLSGCMGPESEEGDTPTPELKRCQRVCLQQLCDPLIDPNPDGDPEQVCMSWCEDQREAIADQTCLEQYDRLISCLEPLSCEQYLHWRDQEADAACLEEEQTLANLCSGVEVPRP